MTQARRGVVLSAWFFLLAFGANLRTLSPAFHPDDSPETITAGYTLSIQHPPGYPLHSLLGRLACLAFPGPPSFAVTTLSALLGALGLLAFAFAARKAAEDARGAPVPLEWAFLPAAVLGLSYTLWFQSSIAKGGIYSLNFALSSGTLLALLHGRLGLAALSFGLGMANHWTSQVVLLPGYALLMLDLWRRGPGAGTSPAPTGLLWILPGLSLYLYLPLRSLLEPVLQWGEPWTLKGFWWVFNRSQYAGIESAKTLDSFLSLVGQVGRDLRLEFHEIGLAAIAGGWLMLFLRRPLLAAALLSLPLSLAFAVCLKANPPPDSLFIIDPYLVPLYSGLALGLCGWAAVEASWRPALAAGLAALALGLGAWHLALADQSRHFLGYDYVQNLLLSCPKNAVVFCEGDSNTAGPLLSRFVMGKRRDCAFIADVLSDYGWYRKSLAKHYPGLKLPKDPLGPAGNIAAIAALNLPRPAIITNSFTKSWVEPARVLPRGLVNRYLEKGPPSLAQLDSNRIFEAYSLRGAFEPALPQDPITTRLVTDNYSEAIARLGEAYQGLKAWSKAEAEYVRLGRLKPRFAAPWVQAGNMAYFRQDLEQAGSHWRRAENEDPRNAEALANVGLYYLSLKKYDLALAQANKALGINPALSNAIQLAAQARQALNQGGAAAQAMSPAMQAQQSAAMGDQLASQNRNDEALAAYDQALKLGYVNAAVHRNRAVLLGRKGDSAGAVAALKQAVALEPGSAELRKYLGIFQMQLGQAKAALAQFEESRRLDPKDAALPALLDQARAAAEK